jgi:hypothetical protein
MTGRIFERGRAPVDPPDAAETPLTDAAWRGPNVRDNLLKLSGRLECDRAALIAALAVVAGCVADSEGGTTLGSYEIGIVRTTLAKVRTP